jgi:hypothetical protein
MSRPRLVALAAALLAAGCVSVTEPLSDIDKAEPDKNLLGKWKRTDGAPDDTVVIETTTVKGHPKGLMRARMKDATLNDGDLWFFCTTIEKKTYANCLADRTKNDMTLPLTTEGEFAKWQKSATRGYIVMLYTVTGDDLVVNYGEPKAIETQFAAQKFEKGTDGFYRTPEGALAKYVAKNGGDIYIAEVVMKYKRVR